MVQPSVEEVARECTLTGWFFIRYLEEQGPHLRFRYQVPDRQMEQAIVLMEEFLASRLATLRDASAIETRRLIPIKGLRTESPWSGESRWKLRLTIPR